MAWFCLQVKARAETSTAHNLRRLGHEVYCPVVRADRRRIFTKRVEIMFPRYLFCELTPGLDDFHPVEKTPGVVKFVRFGLWPARIPDRIVEALKSHESADGVHEISKHDYSNGDEVRIKTGIFQGYGAIIKCKKPEDRIVVVLNAAHTVGVVSSTRLELGREDVEPVAAG